MNSSRRLRPSPSKRQRLLKATEDGSLEAIGRVLDAYRPFLLFTAKEKLSGLPKDKVRPSDVVQDTLRAAFVRFATFVPRGEGAFSGWLLALLENKAIDARRRLFAKKRDVRRERELGSGELDEAVLRRARSDEPSAVEVEEQRGKVLAALPHLPAKYAYVIRAHHERHLTFDEIGKELGCSAEAVRKLWKRATLMLARRLRQAEGEGG